MCQDLRLIWECLLRNSDRPSRPCHECEDKAGPVDRRPAVSSSRPSMFELVLHGPRYRSAVQLDHAATRPAIERSRTSMGEPGEERPGPTRDETVRSRGAPQCTAAADETGRQNGQSQISPKESRETSLVVGTGAASLASEVSARSGRQVSKPTILVGLEPSSRAFIASTLQIAGPDSGMQVSDVESHVSEERENLETDTVLGKERDEVGTKNPAVVESNFRPSLTGKRNRKDSQRSRADRPSKKRQYWAFLDEFEEEVAEQGKCKRSVTFAEEPVELGPPAEDTPERSQALLGAKAKSTSTAAAAKSPRGRLKDSKSPAKEQPRRLLRSSSRPAKKSSPSASNILTRSKSRGAAKTPTNPPKIRTENISSRYLRTQREHRCGEPGMFETPKLSRSRPASKMISQVAIKQSGQDSPVAKTARNTDGVVPLPAAENANSQDERIHHDDNVVSPHRAYCPIRFPAVRSRWADEVIQGNRSAFARRFSRERRLASLGLDDGWTEPAVEYLGH